MANFIRSAKSASQWTCEELLAYNIRVVSQPPEQFFGASAAGISLADLDPLIITGSEDMENLSDSALSYLWLLHLVTTPSEKSFEEPSRNEFARRTLDLLGYPERGIALIAFYTIPLTICGYVRNAEPDMCLTKGESMVLLILEAEKTMSNPRNPESKVIAEAIAAYQYNNERRESRGLASLDSMVLPCITMIGTRPTFYLVPVTKALSDAVKTGQYPSMPTEVRKCVTTASHNRSVSEGMETPEYRRVALERFLAFKTLAKSHWEGLVC